MSNLKREWIFSFVIAGICVGLAFVEITDIPSARSGLHARGVVAAVDNSHVRQNLIVLFGMLLVAVAGITGLKALLPKLFFIRAITL